MAQNIYTVTQELTFATVSAELHNIKKLIHDNPNIAELNLALEDVGHCDSAGLAMLVEVKKMCQKNNIRMILTNTPKFIRGLAVFCGLEKVFDVF